eukprot:2091473-Rhodomonas_salina.1
MGPSRRGCQQGNGGGRWGGGEGYTKNISSVLENRDPRGLEPISLFMKTPLKQTVSGVAVLLYASGGAYLGEKNTQFRVRNVSLQDRSIADGCIISFPGSGNHLSRFMIEFLTLRPTRGCSDLRDLPLYLNEYPGQHPLAGQLYQLPVRALSHAWLLTRRVGDRGGPWSDASDREVALDALVPAGVPRAAQLFGAVLERLEQATVGAARPARGDPALVLLDNVAAFVAFEGAKIVLDYADLTADPDASAAQLAAFFAVEPQRLAAWRAHSETLVRACHGGKVLSLSLTLP